MKIILLFVFSFLVIFLICPIQVIYYVTAGEELGWEKSWIWLGGYNLLYYPLHDFFSQRAYPTFFGNMRVLENFFFLLPLSYVGARFLTHGFIKGLAWSPQNIFWSSLYVKKIFRLGIIAGVLGLPASFLISLFLSLSGVIDWIYENTSIRTEKTVFLPLIWLLMAGFLYWRSLHERNLFTTVYQRIVFSFEGLILGVTTLMLLILVLTELFGY